MTKEYVSIQYLRGLAAILVVIYHLGLPLAHMGFTGTWPNGLSGGVDIFFVISGFVMWVTTRDRSTGPLKFWRKRIVRIVPLYWLITTLMLAILLLAPAVVHTSIYSLPHVVASYAFLAFKNPGKSAMEPLIFPGWTLNYEMFFYAIFGVFLLARPSVRLIGTISVLVALVTAGAVFTPPSLSVAGFYSSDIMLEFAFGMILGEVVSRLDGRALLTLPIGIALLAGGLAFLILFPHIVFPRSALYGIPGLAIVTGALAIETSGWIKYFRIPHEIGNASYSIYLTQMITMAAFNAAWERLHLNRLPASMWLFVVASVLVAISAGWLCYRFVESRMAVFFKNSAVKTKSSINPVMQPITSD